jgi:hypothetical protein
VYVEDQGTAQATGYTVHNSADAAVAAPIQPIIRTRRIYAGGLDRDWRETRIFLLYAQFGNTTTAVSTTTINSATVTSSAAFGTVEVGMRVTGIGIVPGTIVLTKPDSNTITITAVANVTGSTTLTFDSGTIAVSIRGAAHREAVATLTTGYDSTVLGDLLSMHPDNLHRGMELQIEKVILPSGSSVDLGVNLRLHQFVIMSQDGGTDQSRSTGEHKCQDQHASLCRLRTASLGYMKSFARY